MLRASSVPSWRKGEVEKAMKKEPEVEYLVPSRSSSFSHYPSFTRRATTCPALSLARLLPDFDFFVALLAGDKESRTKKKNQTVERGGYTP